MDQGMRNNAEINFWHDLEECTPRFGYSVRIVL